MSEPPIVFRKCITLLSDGGPSASNRPEAAIAIIPCNEIREPGREANVAICFA